MKLNRHGLPIMATPRTKQRLEDDQAHQARLDQIAAGIAQEIYDRSHNLINLNAARKVEPLHWRQRERY